MKVTKICQYKASLVVIDVYSFFWGWMFKNGKILNNKKENKQKFKGNKKIQNMKNALKLDYPQWPRMKFGSLHHCRSSSDNSKSRFLFEILKDFYPKDNVTFMKVVK